jgi:WD40 repeat protein
MRKIAPIQSQPRLSQNSLFSRLPIFTTMPHITIQEGVIMARESRDWKHSHTSDDDRADDSADQQEQNEERSQDESADGERMHRHDRPHHPAPDDREEESREHHGSNRPAHEHQHHHHSDEQSGEHAHAHEHARDPAKFASYDDGAGDDADSEREPERHFHRHKERAQRSEHSHRAEPARPYSDFRGGARPDAASYSQQATTTRVATDAAPYPPSGAADPRPAGSYGAAPSALNDPALAAYPASQLHPYDHHRAALIGLSTALVAAIIIIVALMANFSAHNNLAPEVKQQYETRMATFQQDYQSAQTLADQRLAQAQQAAALAERNQQLAQANAQAYQVSQQQLRQHQQVNQQLQQQSQAQLAENEQRTYVTQIRMAKQAWDRGDTNQVLQLLEPYRSDPARQKYRSFAWYYLWRAAHSGGSNTLRGHSDVVRQVAVTPDGAQIVSFADDGQLIVWDAALGRKLSAVTLERNVPPRSAGLIVEDQLARRASGLVVSDNGAWAAAYGRDLFVGANIRQPDSVRPVSDHTSPIISLAISRNGTRLVSGDYSGEIVLRDATDGRVIRRFHNPRPLSLALSADGSLIFAGMHDGALFVWDAGSGNLLGTRAFGDGINSMSISPDGSALALALAVRDGVVKIWEPATGKFRGDLRGHHDEVTRVVWSRDGKSVLTASRDQTACLWSSTGALLRTFRGHLGDVEAAAFSPDGQKVVTASDDQTVILWNVDGGQPCDMLTDTPVDGWVSGLAFTPDSSQVIGSGSCDGAGDSYEAFLTDWNLLDGNRPAPLQTSSRSGVALAFSPDGRQMVVGESSPPQSTVKSRARIWSLDPPRVLATVPKLAGSVYSVAYSNDGRSLAIGTGDVDERVAGTALIVEPATGALRQKLPDLPGKVEAVFTADSRYLITVNGSKKRPAEIRFWNPQTGQLAAPQIDNPELANLTTIALSPDGRYLVTGHGDPVNPAAADKAKIKIWDLATQKLLGQFPAAHPAAITRIAFSRRGVLMASGDMAGNVRIWDFTSHKLLPTQIKSQNRPITFIAFDKLGERLAVAADEKVVRVWHIDSGRELADMELALGVPNVVGYTQDGKTLAAATSAGGLFLWDADTYKPRAVLRGEGNPAGQQGHGGVITCVAAMTLPDKMLTGSVDKTVRVWDLKNRQAVGTVAAFNQAASCMAVSPDGRTLAVGTGKYRSKFETGELAICDLTGKTPQRSITQGITPVSMAFSPDGNYLAVCSLSAAVGTASRTVSIIDTHTYRASPLGSTNGQCVAFSPDGKILAVGCADGSVELWPLDSQGGKPYVVKKHSGLVWMLAFSPDGKTLASGGADNNVVIWDVLTAEDLMTFKHNGTVEAVRFSPDGRILASAGHEPSRGSVCLWRAPLDDDGSQSPLQPAGGPRFSDRSTGLDSGMVTRPAYPDATARPSGPSVPIDYSQSASRSTDPSTPLNTGYSQPADDRYGTAPLPAQNFGTSQPNNQLYSQPNGGATTDPSVPPGADSAQPGAGQGSPGGSPRSGGRHARPPAQ